MRAQLELPLFNVHRRFWEMFRRDGRSRQTCLVFFVNYNFLRPAGKHMMSPTTSLSNSGSGTEPERPPAGRCLVTDARDSDS